MAYITNIDFEGEEAFRLDPTATVAKCKFARNEYGDIYLNIRSHGSKNRENPNDLSQKLQLGPDALVQLKRILAGV